MGWDKISEVNLSNGKWKTKYCEKLIVVETCEDKNHGFNFIFGKPLLRPNDEVRFISAYETNSGTWIRVAKGHSIYDVRGKFLKCMELVEN